ncbi:hypothetical protein [Chondromyces crocatus]|uniref:hypothetical protein n=1 Tax=Chondromyces crocatus TaxID=52 RepID=UPI0012E256CD|nr:hypothetical protein [Chondromyces crocatus]
MSRSALLVGALLGFSTMGTVCGPAVESPPAEVTCDGMAAPGEGEPVLLLVDPETKTPLLEGATLQTERGPELGTYVYVTLRHYTADVEGYIYALRVVQDGYPETGALVAEGTSFVGSCSGWTEVVVPLALNLFETTPATLRLQAQGGGQVIEAEMRVNVAY